MIYLNEKILSTPLNIQKVKENFWDKFSDHYEEIKEITCYLFVDDEIEKPIEYIKEQMGSSYDKYIANWDENTKIIKFKEKYKLKKIEKKLKKINILNGFKEMIQIKLPANNVRKEMEYYLYDDLLKKYSINIDEKMKKNNLLPFSLKNNFKYATLIQNLNSNKIHRIYYVKTNKSVSEEELKKLESKFKILHKNKFNKKIILQDLYYVENKTEEIKKILINIKNNVKSELIYETNSEKEIEQILIKVKKENLEPSNSIFLNYSITRKKLTSKIIKKDYQNISNSEEFSTHNSMHNVIIITNKEGKINQSLRDKIYNFISFDNIVNFEEIIYLSKKNFFSVPKEKYSFQFLVKDFFKDEKNRKKFKNLINQHKHSCNKTYKFLNKNSNDIELEIIPIEKDPLKYSSSPLKFYRLF